MELYYHRIPRLKGPHLTSGPTFAGKPQYWQDNPAPCPAESKKWPTLGNPHSSMERLFKWLLLLWKFSLRSNKISSGGTCTYNPLPFPYDFLKKQVSIFFVDTLYMLEHDKVSFKPLFSKLDKHSSLILSPHGQASQYFFNFCCLLLVDRGDTSLLPAFWDVSLIFMTFQRQNILLV